MGCLSLALETVKLKPVEIDRVNPSSSKPAPLPNSHAAIQVLDTHTGGEPTRVVLSGMPDLGPGDLVTQRRRFAEQFDHLRRGIACEPRGSDVMVGALLLPPVNQDSIASVIFFNNVGYLGMCGHGTIGVGVALAHLGRIGAGVYRLDTPVGTIAMEYLGDGRVRLENVASRRSQKQIAVKLEDGQTVHGDVAWGGNWFFISDDHGEVLDPKRIDALTRKSWQIRHALEAAGIAGDDGGEIDHIELVVADSAQTKRARGFVLCPGGAYDRSPCGTGTSAKVACLAADGKLKPGEVWHQESIIGSVFEATYRQDGKHVIPTITGSAYIAAEATLHFTADDPFNWGIGT